MNDLYPIEGPSLPLRREAFTSARARATHAALQWYPYYQLLDAKIFEEFGFKFDALIVDVSPELPQVKTQDIRYREPLVLCFEHEDRRLPRVQARRKDFPSDVAHLNLVPLDTPRELCVYAEPLEIVQLTWTAPDFLRRIAKWLANTATGTLHAPDQPLEPFFFPNVNDIIVPYNIFTTPSPEGKRLVGVPIVRQENPLQYSARLQWHPIKETQKYPWALVVLSYETAPRVHGLIHGTPRHLKELQDLLAQEQTAFNSWLRDKLRELFMEQTPPRDGDLLLLLLRLPQLRHANGAIERIEHWAFVIGQNIIETSVAVGACAKAPEGGYAPLIQGGVPQILGAGDLTQISIEPLRVISELTRDDAIRYSGIKSSKANSKCVLIGAGALGSQVYLALAKMGWGNWSVVDDDVYLPHNTVRHVLGDNCVGFSKAQALGLTTTSQVPYNPPRAMVPRNAMDFNYDESLRRTLEEADIIVDASTSLAVARMLARDIDSKARRLSAFLTPSGKDCVVMIESADRTYRLDEIEQQYYRAILRDKRLDNHLEGHSGSIRYGGSCRDVTSVIALDDILIHAGIITKQIRNGVENDDPTLIIWRSSEIGSVTRVPVTLSPSKSSEIHGWRVLYDDAIVKRCAELRAKSLPNETGGILVGYFDALRKQLFLVDALPAPPDSQEHTTAFIRGVSELRASLDSISEKTAQIVHYVGEWHSHPVGAKIGMSTLDEHLLREIAHEMRFEGWPGMILIMGDAGQCAMYVQTAEES